MSVCELLEKELNQLERGGALVEPQTATIRGDGYRLTCELTGIGALGCAVNHLTVQSEGLADASIDQLKAKAEHLASQLTYLLERVAPIEIDSEGCTVQLRSDPPHREADERSYYELLVRRGGQLSLRRYRQESHQPREPIAAQLTREVLVRLAADLVGAL